MIPARHFDHVATVWRFQEVRTSALRSAERVWSPVAEDRPIGLQRRRGAWESRQGGEASGGEWKGYASASLEVCDGDVLEITGGRMAPLTLEVDEAYPPRSHHTELVLVPWDGELS